MGSLGNWITEVKKLQGDFEARCELEDERYAALEARVEALEHFRSPLSKRTPMRIPKFPKALREIGLNPPASPT